MAANMSDEEAHKVSIRVLVDKEKNKVVYAEAGNDFVDVLFSFLTLPLGTIVRFMAKETDNIVAVKVGSLSSLYQSVADLDEQYLWTRACKEMLLKPRNSMEAYCRKLKLNIDDAEPLQYFSFECTCPVYKCLTIFENQKSHCGKPVNQVNYPYSLDIENGFVVQTASFIISDDLHVLPSDIGTNVSLLRMHGNDDIELMEIKTILIGTKEVVDLLKLSLLSKTPLTDFIFKKKQFPDNSNPSEFENRQVDSSEEDKKMELKLLLRKSTGEILVAEAKEDFADLLASFLTFPLGGVFRMLEGFTSLGSIDNLYKSMAELNADSYFRSQELKDKLALIQIAKPFQICDQILPIGAEPLPDAFKHFDFVDPKSPTGHSCGGYVRGPVKYMVTDNLVLTPMSPIDVVSSLQMKKVPLNDLEEKVVSIGVNEALSILKASLTSTSALTNGLNQFITKALLCKKDQQEMLEVEAAHQKDTVMEPNDEKSLEEAESAKEGHEIGQQSQQNLIATEMSSSGSSENLQAREKERESGCLAQDPDYMPAIKSRLFKPDMTMAQFNHGPKSYSAPTTLKTMAQFNHGPKSYSAPTTLKTTLNKKGIKKRKTGRKQPKPENCWSTSY